MATYTSVDNVLADFLQTEKWDDLLTYINANFTLEDTPAVTLKGTFALPTGTTVNEISTTVDGSSTDDQLATAKACYDAIDIQDLDFLGDTGNGSVDLNTQNFSIVGTTNEIVSVANAQTLTLSLPDQVTIGSAVSPDGTLHVHTATAGSVTPSGSADDFVIENSADAGMTILAPDGSSSSVNFGSPTDAVGAFINWTYNSGAMVIGTSKTGGDITFRVDNGQNAMIIESTKNVDILTSLSVDTNTLVVNATGYADKVGINQATPEGTLHIETGSSGLVTISSLADDLIVENSTDGGISILTPDASTGMLAFGSASDGIGASITWTHDSSGMVVGTEKAGGTLALRTADGVGAMTIDASQNVTALAKLDVIGNIDPTSYETTNGGFLDDDTFGTSSATTTASSESIKAYVDANDFWTRDAGNGYLYPETITDKVGINTIAPTRFFELNTTRTLTADMLIKGTSGGSGIVRLDRTSDARLSGHLYSTADVTDWYSGIPYNTGSATSVWMVGSSYNIADANLLIDSSGNVDIPTGTLDVAGVTTLDNDVFTGTSGGAGAGVGTVVLRGINKHGTAFGSNGELRFSSTTNNSASDKMWSIANNQSGFGTLDFFQGAPSSGVPDLSGTPRVSFDFNGNVLINTDLDVIGAVGITGLITANGGVTLGAGADLIGSTTSDINFGSGNFTVAGATGNTEVGGTLTIDNIDPSFYMIENDGFSNSKVWRTVVTGHDMYHQITDDAVSASETWLKVSRSLSNTIVSVNFENGIVNVTDDLNVLSDVSISGDLTVSGNDINDSAGVWLTSAGGSHDTTIAGRVVTFGGGNSQPTLVFDGNSSDGNFAWDSANSQFLVFDDMWMQFGEPIRFGGTGQNDPLGFIYASSSQMYMGIDNGAYPSALINVQTGTLYETNTASYYRDTAIYINSGADGYLDLAADTGIRLNNNVTIGNGAAATDFSLTFDGETTDGIITWMEDEDYFKYSDDILMDTTERIYFRDTDISIYSDIDGSLTVTADGQITVPTDLVLSDDGDDLIMGTGGTNSISVSGGVMTVTGTQDVIFDTSDIVLQKTSGVGMKVDIASPTFGWKDLPGDIKTRPAAGGGAAAQPDYVAYRGSIYGYRFGTNAPNNHLHECFVEFHLPHDYVPGSDIYIHTHWSQTTVDTGGPAAVPGDSEWFFDVSYAKGYGTAGGSGDPFIAPITTSVVCQGSTTQYAHMICEVQLSDSSPSASQLDSDNLEVDGILLVRVYRTPSAGNDTLDQDTFLHYVDIHHQSTNMPTKDKNAPFYS